MAQGEHRSPAQPCFSRPAPWAVAKRIRGKFASSLRPIPDDFEVLFVEIGRLACEENYGVGDNTITRWLKEAGEERLKRLREDYVRQRDRDARLRLLATGRVHLRRKGEVPHLSAEIVAAAARFVCHARVLSVASSRDRPRVDIFPRTATELIDLAERLGFDVETATLKETTQSGVNGGR